MGWPRSRAKRPVADIVEVADSLGHVPTEVEQHPSNASIARSIAQAAGSPLAMAERIASSSEGSRAIIAVASSTSAAPAIVDVGRARLQVLRGLVQRLHRGERLGIGIRDIGSVGREGEGAAP